MSAAASTHRGLDSAEAARRLAADGYNELPRAAQRSIARIVVEVLREPMFRLLLAAGAIYLLLGDLGEALLLLLFASASVLITIVQQTRTERSLEALRELGSPRALVIRDGRQQRIAGRELVRGDLVMLGEGDRVPADLRLLSARDLQADESLLTGESLAVGKTAATAEAPPAQPGGDGLPYAYAGTLIVRGEGLGEVVATGTHSQLGEIGRLLAATAEAPSPLQQQTSRLVRRLAAAGLGLSALIVLLYGLLRDAWLDGLLAGIALAMAMLPEEFPLVLTVFLALGAWRLAGRKVLTRRAAAIETLGATTVLCTDKTGTLTQNRMTVALLAIDGAQAAPPVLPAPFMPLLAAALRATRPLAVDPMDRALQALAELLPPAEALPPESALAHEFGLRPELPAITQMWRTAEPGRYDVAAKGAPEAIAELCRLDATRRAALRRDCDAMAARGIRVLGVARCGWRGAVPTSPHALGLQWQGLVGFSDPLRETVPAAIDECRAAGLRVVMITGDYPATARAIAEQAGIGDDGSVLDGATLATLDDAALRARVRQTSLYARIAPAQKLRIVEALKAGGEVVAMTGDGVNDAPSLKAAHIGVAMGGRGTDVAREAAALVLLDDDFSSLVGAVRDGRRIYDNIRKAMSYILAVHVPIAGIALLPLVAGWPLILTPVHIVFLELLIDPVCSIVFEAEPAETDLMRRRPRDPREPLLPRRLIAWSLAQGTAVLLAVSGLFVFARLDGLPLETARALAFSGLVLTNFALIFVNRGTAGWSLISLRRPNPAMWRVLALTTMMLGAALYLPLGRRLFGFGELPATELLLAVTVATAMVGVLDLAKRWIGPYRRSRR